MSQRIREWVHMLLTFTTFLFIVSGIGIIEFNLIGIVTFGLLTKDRSYLLHSMLLYPFTVLLLLHVYYKTKFRRKRE